VSAAFWGRIDLVLLLLALALIVLWKHRDNIERLLNGTEPRIGKKSD
jgi:glycerol-3-phosphate acyltransferase PlsY